MKPETVERYTILYKYLLLLKEPLYLFLTQIFHHLSPADWWEEFIEPVLQRENKENFKYLDIADLLNVFKMNWEKIFVYLDKDYRKYKYDKQYRMVNRVHRIRTIVAHANESDMTSLVFSNSLAALLDFSKLIQARKYLPQQLEQECLKYPQILPSKSHPKRKTEELKEKILATIEEKVLLKAINFEGLELDIKLSIDRTMQRLNSMRTLEEILGFFNNAQLSKRGMFIRETLHRHGLLAFEDIKDEINRLYDEELGTDV
jgi:hypothetical protein